MASYGTDTSGLPIPRHELESLARGDSLDQLSVAVLVVVIQDLATRLLARLDGEDGA